MAPRQPLEIEIQAASGRVRRYRLGRLAASCVAALVLLLVTSLVLSIVALPSILARERQQQAMAIALARRSQLGERLHALVERGEELQRQVDAQAFRVGQIRRLYGLPELAAPASADRAELAAADTIYAGAVLYASRRLAAIESRLVATGTLLGALASWEADHADEVASVPALFPLATGDVVPTAGFGVRPHPVTGESEFHPGVDFAAPEGTPIRASAAAVVRWAGEPPPNAGDAWWRLGRIVVLAHGTRYRTIYGHCDRILVRVGERVALGQPIATVGKVSWAPLPRLHYEVRRRGVDGAWQAVDPTLLLLVAPWREEGIPAPPLPHPATTLQPPPLPPAFAR